MSKSKYLVLKTNTHGETYLDLASKDEWNSILQSNRTALKSERRYFIRETIVDGEDVDSIFIEVSAEEYKEWHREHEAKRRKLKQEDGVVILSLNDKCSGPHGDELIDQIPSDENTEKDVVTNIMFEELQASLISWKPWALELLQAFMTLPKDHIICFMVETYGISVRSAQRRKKEFEEYVRKYLEDCE